MPDAESFIAAIAANPADDLPRLVFADWLEENVDPTRAGFIRDHVRLAKLRPGTDEYKTLFRKCADTLKANLPEWIKPACDAFGQPAEWKPGKGSPSTFTVLLGKSLDAPLRELRFSRGFVTSAELFLELAGTAAQVSELFRLYPITVAQLALPLTPQKVQQVLPSTPLPVRRLSLFGRFTPTSYESTLANPALGNVCDFTLDGGTGEEVFNRSPLARRLVTLRVPPDLAVLTTLREFPLDDRLQEFVVSEVPVSHSSPPAASATGDLLARYFRRVNPEGNEVWSALSRVSFRPTLKRLDLTRCGMTDDGLAAFARGEEWVRLQGLKLGGNLFGDTGWSDFCRGWRTPELTYLDASRNRLTDDGADMLSRSGMLKTLRVIDLRGNRIAGRGAVALARAVAEGKLNKLLLAGNPVGKREAATVKGLLGERSDLASGGR